jgi:ribosome-associated protein
VLDVRDRSSVADYFILVSGGSPPHLKALFDAVQHSLKESGVYCFRRTVDAPGGWMVLDYLDVVIHIFLPETRAYYGIEALWSGAPPA